jgi:hypothetical protein
MLIFTVLPLFAAKKPDARSAYLQQMPAKYALESLDAFQSVGNGKAFIKMFHNEESVKVLIAVPEENMQIKFLMQGLKVYLDVAGKKTKSITYNSLESNGTKCLETCNKDRNPVSKE